MSYNLILHFFVFMGSFLLFTMEPMVARIILPNFGGAFHVWSITITFFQGALFLGYAYCHYIAKNIGKFHFLLVLLALIWIPISITFPTPNEISPTALLLHLILNYAIPFGVLATTSVIAQSWFSYYNKNRESPYQLYISSNAGSLVALISYIVIFEPMLGLQTQKIIWFIGFIIYTGLAWKCQKPLVVEKNEKKFTNKNKKTIFKNMPYWLLLSALPSGFMLATTNAITLELGSMPLVWIIPLSIYLLSFILTFSNKLFLSNRLIYGILPSALMLGLCSLYTISIGATWQIAAHIISLFFLALVGHRELYNRRPEREKLTQFYLTISLGGWLGGAFVSFISPIAFDSLLEYPIIISLFLIVILAGKTNNILNAIRSTPLYSTCSFICLVSIPWLIGFDKFRISNDDVIYQKRNFYGIYRITDNPLLHYAVRLGYKDIVAQLIKDNANVNSKSKDGWTPLDLAIKNKKSEIANILMQNGAKKSDELLKENQIDEIAIDNSTDVNPPMIRKLMHGSTSHGEQLIHPQAQRIATSYYHANGPLGKIFKPDSNKQTNTAIIGLGIGTCATYFSKNDKLTFYELDDEIVKIAKDNFTFLDNCKADLEIITGDARIKLNEAKNHIYDVIFVDAFSSDAIPTHLLTKEAMNLYQSKLAPGGTLILHISNRHYELLPVIHSTSKNKWKMFNYQTLTIQPFQHFAKFCALRNKEHNTSDLVNAGWLSMDNFRSSARAWSDDYINTLAPLYERFKIK